MAKQILDKTWLGPKWFRKLVSIWFKLNEKFCSLFYSGIITSTDDILKNFKSRKSIAIHNYPNLELIKKAKIPNIEKKRPAIIYAGALTELRGIYELIEAVGKLNGRVELWLLGIWENSSYETKCKEAIGFRYTQYFGNRSIEEVYGFYKLADIGASVLYPINRYLTAIPTKIVECMSVGIPTILTGRNYLKNYFEDNAIFIEEYSIDNISAAINKLITDQGLSERISLAAKKMVDEKMSWQKEANRLNDFYLKILGDQAELIN